MGIQASLLLGAGAWSAESLGTISGIVLSAVSGAPLASSTVVLSQADGAPLRTVTADRRGRYVFDGLAAGQYAVKASRPGFATGRYGQQAWNHTGRPIELGAGAGFTADVRLHRLGVVTGAVVDENGEGVPGLPVNAVTVSPAGVSGRTSSAGITDDRGVFRIPGLRPGRYRVRTAPRQLEDGTGLLPSYAPGTLDQQEARIVTAEVDRETTGVSIQVLAGKLARLTGFVPAAARHKDAQVTVTLFRDEDSRQVTAGPGGQFGFSEVVPGRYTLVAQLRSAEASLAAYQPLDLSGDLEGLFVNLSAAPEVQVRLFDEKGAPVTDPQFVVFLGRIENAARTTPLRVEGTVAANLMPGRWRFYLILPETHVVESIRVGDEEALDGFVLLPGSKATATIRVGRRAGRVQGRVTDASGRPARGLPVVCYPLAADNRLRLGGFRTARTSLTGDYRFGGLPEGEYLVFASPIEDFQPDEHLEALRERLRPQRVTASKESPLDLRVLE